MKINPRWVYFLGTSGSESPSCVLGTPKAQRPGTGVMAKHRHAEAVSKPPARHGPLARGALPGQSLRLGPEHGVPVGTTPPYLLARQWFAGCAWWLSFVLKRLGQN